jgi:hypothetical protein
MTPPAEGGGLMLRQVREPALRFFLEDAPSGVVPSRLAAARAALREAEEAERQERLRLAHARLNGLTSAHAALLQLRQAQSQAAQSAVADLRRRAAWLRQAIALGEEAIAAQRALLDRLGRELAEISE